MKTSNKADGIFSTDLLSNEVICIHTDGSVDVISDVASNDEVENIEHDVELTVQNDDKSPKVFSFEECKAAAEQCEDVGEFILKFTDEYDCAHQNDWLKDLFEKNRHPSVFGKKKRLAMLHVDVRRKQSFMIGIYRRMTALVNSECLIHLIGLAQHVVIIQKKWFSK